MVLFLVAERINDIIATSKVRLCFYIRTALGASRDVQNSERRCPVVHALYEAENRITNGRRTRARGRERREREILNSRDS